MIDDMRKFFFLIFMIVLLIPSFGLSSSTVKSFVTICPSRFYFEIAGKPLIPIGFNDGITWPSLIDLWKGESGLWGAKASFQKVEKYFRLLRTHGVNVLRIFFEYDEDTATGFSLFENPLGKINKSLVDIWDHILKYAEEYDIYLIIEPFDPYWMSKNWSESPFNVKNGGPIRSLDEFLTSREVIRDTKFRFKFMIDRWGSSSHILAWEINNEIDLWYGHDNALTIKKYIRTIADFIVNYEDSKFGKHHLVTISTAAPVLSGNLANFIYNNDRLDFVTTHLYLPSVNNPIDVIKPAIEVSHAVVYNLRKMNYSKPYIDSEDGPINNWPLPLDFDVEYYHNMSWAEFASGACGIGLRWPYRIPHMMPDEFLDVDKAVSKFVNSPGINWLRFKAYSDPSDIEIRGTARDYIIPFSCGDKSERIVWLLKDSRKNLNGVDFSVINFKIYGLENGNYTVEFWNTYTGEILNSIRIKAINGSINLRINFSKLKDVALKVYKD